MKYLTQLNHHKYIAGILFLAFLVRTWGIDFGLPNQHMGDESMLIYWSFYSAAKYLQPLKYLYGSLLPLLLLMEYAVVYAFGYLGGFFNSPIHFYEQYLINPTLLMLIGRVTIVVSSVTTVWVIWIIGKTFFSHRVGLIAAFFLSLTFIHVKESHYIKQDVLATFFLLSSFYFALEFSKKGIKTYVWAAITFACALSVKYPAGLILIVIILAYYWNLKKKRKELILFLFISGITFSIINPYFIIAPIDFIRHVIQESAAQRISYESLLENKPVWWWLLFSHIPQGLGLPLFITSIAGFYLLFRKSFGYVHSRLILAFPLVFFLTVDVWTQYHFDRYAIMVVPFFILSAAVFCETLLNKMNARFRKIATVILCVCIMYPSLAHALTFDRIISTVQLPGFTQTDTRQIAREWIEQHIPAGSKIVLESAIRPEYPSDTNVPLYASLEQLKKRRLDALSRSQPVNNINAIINARNGQVGYELMVTSRIDYAYDIVTSETQLLENVDYYVGHEMTYLVLTNWVSKPDMTKKFEESLENAYERIYEIKPTYVFPQDPHFVALDYSILDSISFLKKDIIFGPVIQVYKIRSHIQKLK